MTTSGILAAAGAVTAASLELLLPAHPFLPSAVERWGAGIALPAAALEGALVFLLFGRWLPTESPWREPPSGRDPDPGGGHGLARRMAVSAPLLLVFAGQRWLLGAERIGLVLAGTLAEAVESLACAGSPGCRTAVVTGSLIGVNLLFAVCFMGPVWWLEAEASSFRDRHPSHHHRFRY